MRNTRNLFKKIVDIKGKFHARMGMIKDKNKDLIKQKILRRNGKNTERSYQKKKKSLNDLDNHNDVVTHLEPDILECEVKWDFRSV